MIQFTPTRDFPSPEMRSLYLKGLTYTVRPGNAKLAYYVKEWLEAGLVEITNAPASRLQGKE